MPAPAMRQVESHPLGPTTSFELVELVDRLNGLERKAGKPEKWNRWNIRTFLKGLQIRTRQDDEGGKIYVLWADLKASGLLDSMLDVEADLADD